MDRLDTLWEKNSVLEVVNDLFVSTDLKDWAALRRTFDQQVRFDLSSLTGMPSALVAAEKIIEGWQKGLANIPLVKHLVANIKVVLQPDGAAVTAYGCAVHHIPGTPPGKDIRVILGSYDLHLVKRQDQWVVDRFRFVAQFVGGNPQLGNP